MSIQQMLLAAVGVTGPGQEVLTRPSGATTSYSGSWTVPAGVTSVSVVCIGSGGSIGTVGNRSGCSGGGLGYKNNISVTPGSSISYQIGGRESGTWPAVEGQHGASTTLNGDDTWFVSSSTVRGGGASEALYVSMAGGDYTGDGGGNGGDGGKIGSSAASNTCGGGGGAGGYSGDGGDGGEHTHSNRAYGNSGGNGSGGGGGGGGSGIRVYNSDSGGGNGGGTGLLGEGSNGSGGWYAESYGNPGYGGGGGSGGTNGPNSAIDAVAGAYGGGAGGAHGSNQLGAFGAIRIMWPGDERSYPSTRTADE